MATLYFKVSSDYDEVIRLRKECEKLEAQLKKMDVNKSPAAVKALETQLASARQQMMGLVTEAAKAGAVMENDLKKKLNSASKASDELTEEIIKQRKIIRDTQDDVRRLSDEYSKMGKYSPNSKAKLAELNRAKAALNEQRYSLGELQDQQARNRLEVRKLTREYKEFSSGTNNADEIVKSLTDSLKRTAVEIGGLVAIKKFGSDVIEATGKMQQLQVALSTILQDKSKADQLIADIVQFAAKTPFNLDDVTTGAKQLLAYGSSADNVVNELSMLGDVASGLQIPIGQLIYLYGTLRTQGRAMTVDIRQFAGRGIPIYEELAKVLGVSKDQVGELVKEGKVGFKEVEQAFKNMTSEGGKFANLMESSAGTWPQRLSNIEDTLFQKMNEFGNKYKEVFEFGIGTAEDLVESLDDVLSIMGGLIAAYGTYKAALITAAVAQKAVGFVESIRLIVMYRKELGLATAAQQAFNVASKSNVYVALLATLVGIGTAIYMYTKRTNEATVAQETLNSVNKKADEEFSKQAATVDRLSGVLKSETSSLDQKKKALSDLQAIIPSYNASLDEEGRLINNNTEAIKSYLTQLEKQIRMKAAQEELEELYRKKRVQEKQQKVAMENYNEAKSLYNSSVTMTGSALQNRGVNTGVTVFSQNSAVNNQLKDSANKAKKELDSVNKELGETVSAITELEKEIEKSSLSDNKESPQSSISKEVENATKRIKTLKQELADLRSGKLQVEAGKTVESAISSKEKELQSAEKTLETLTGISRKEETKKVTDKQQNLAEALLQLRFQNQQDEINLMQEGSEKKRKQIELDYKKELAEIKKIEKEWSEKNGGKLTQDQSVEISIKYSNAENKHKEGLSGLVEEEQQKLQSMLEKYQDYAAQREAIEKQLNEDITYLETQRTEENSANIDRAIKVAKEKAAKAVKEITDEESKALVNDSGIFARLFSDSSSMTKASLKKVIAEAKTLVEYLSGISIEKPLGFTEDQLEALKGDAESIKEIYDALIEKQDELDKRTDYPFDGIVKGFRKIKESSELAKRAIEETNEEKRKLLQSQSEAEYGKGVSYLKDGALEASDAVGFLAEQVSILAEATGDAKFKEFSDQFSAFSQNLQAAGQGAQSGGWIGAIVGGASNMITQTVASMAQLQSEAYEYEQNRIDFLREIEKISLSLKDEDYDSIFGTSSIEKARDAYDLAREALEKYNEELQRTSALELEEEYKNLGAAIFAPIFGSFGFGKRISEETKALMAAYEKGYTDLQAMAVKTKDRSGWANFWGKKDEYTALKDLAPELWNEDGTFNVEAAQAFLDTNTQISDEQRKQIQNVIDLKNAYDENIAIIDELLASTFGSLGSDITDIIFDSVRNGTDAWEQFREVGSEIIDELGRQMIQELYVQTYLETFKERMRAAYGLDSVEDTQKELANIMNDIYNGLEGVLDGASSAAEEWDKWAKDHGFTPGEEDTESSSQTATRKGFTTMSQDTADELNGRFTALYESNLRLETIGQQQAIAITELRGPISSLTAQASGMYNIADETRTILANSYLELQQIRENTGEIVKPIKQMQADIAEVKRNTSRL